MTNIYTIAHDFRQAFRQRLSEWAFALFMALYGVVLLTAPQSFGHDGYAIIRTMISENLLGWALLLGGVLRCAVLASNGVWWQMYGGRAWFAWSSAVVWLSLSVGFAESGTIGIPLALFPVLTVFDFFNAVRAVQDAAVRRVETRQLRLVHTSHAVGHEATKRDAA